jgi:hypothetical protein
MPLLDEWIGILRELRDFDSVRYARGARDFARKALGIEAPAGEADEDDIEEDEGEDDDEDDGDDTDDGPSVDEDWDD